jgi:hypothetical protein
VALWVVILVLRYGRPNLSIGNDRVKKPWLHSCCPNLYVLCVIGFITAKVM